MCIAFTLLLCFPFLTACAGPPEQLMSHGQQAAGGSVAPVLRVGRCAGLHLPSCRHVGVTLPMNGPSCGCSTVCVTCCDAARAPPPSAGALPGDWSDMAVLQGLDLSNNDLTGPLPASWGTLRDLQVRTVAAAERAGWARQSRLVCTWACRGCPSAGAPCSHKCAGLTNSPCPSSTTCAGPGPARQRIHWRHPRRLDQRHARPDCCVPRQQPLAVPRRRRRRHRPRQ